MLGLGPALLVSYSTRNEPPVLPFPAGSFYIEEERMGDTVGMMVVSRPMEEEEVATLVDGAEPLTQEMEAELAVIEAQGENG